MYYPLITLRSVGTQKLHKKNSTGFKKTLIGGIVRTFKIVVCCVIRVWLAVVIGITLTLSTVGVEVEDKWDYCD
jgi:hypothetical protein